MKFRVRDYCRIILYLPPEEKLKLPLRKSKPKRIEDEVEERVSEDDSPVNPEDASNPSSSHRPPSYNPEDYAHAITKYARSSNIYAQDQRDKKVRGKDKSLKGSNQEMSLKQFASLPELLRRLREDLKMAYISFVKEFVRDPHDGVTLLLDLLKMIQLTQTNLSGSRPTREQQIAIRRALIDEFECLSCLRCCLRCSESQSKLANYENGLYCLSAATMSSLIRNRTLALQLLTKACDASPEGHRQILEAFSTLRLRFSEPVRYKFLVSMMLSHANPSFQIWCLRFFNALVGSSGSSRERVYLQEELREAGFDTAGIKKGLEHTGSATPQQQSSVFCELQKWNENYIDIGTLEEQLVETRSSNKSLHQELQSIRQANMKLLEENVLLKTVGGEVEFRCAELKRRLTNHGISPSPSSASSVIDSEISSWDTNGRSTIRKCNGESAIRTHGSMSSTMTQSTIDGEMNSPSWTMVHNPPEMRFMQNKQPVPKPQKRQSVARLEETQVKREPRKRHKSNISMNSSEAATKPLGDNESHVTHLNVMDEGLGKLEEQLRRTKSLTQIEDHEKLLSSNASMESVSSCTKKQSSSTSWQGENRTDHPYANVSAIDSGQSISRGSSDGEIEYERDVVVYEAITLGNQTIVLDKANASKTSSSKSTVPRQSCVKSGEMVDAPSVRQSVLNYENMAQENSSFSRTSFSTEETVSYGSPKSEKRDIPNSFCQEESSNNEMPNHMNDSTELSELEIKEVISDLEGVIRSAESSISLHSNSTVKETPSNDTSMEIPPPVPPRTYSTGSSSSAGTFTEAVHLGILRSIKPQTYGKENRGSSNSLISNANDHKSKKEMRKKSLQRSESLQTTSSDYNSHRSYSPKHKMRSKRVPEFKEHDVHINGRTYKKYTVSSDVEENTISDNVRSELKRRRNRSIDDQLNRSFVRQLGRNSSWDGMRKSHNYDTESSYRGNTNENRKKTFNRPNPKDRKRRYEYLETDVDPNFAFGQPMKYNSKKYEQKPYTDSFSEDPHIPTPDYSSTPSGTLTYSSSGRHILDIPSGLY